MGFGDGYNTVIRFAHITDLHMTTDDVRNFNIKKVLPHLIEDIKTFNPHFLLFSGDISYSGNTKEFDEVDLKFISKIIDDTNLDNDRIILTPGNHDIDWNMLKLINKKLIKEINNPNELTNFFRNEEKTDLINHTRKSYLDFSQKYRFTKSKVIDDNFVSYKRLIFDEKKDNKKINIVSLSTNVLSRVNENPKGSERDYGSLAIGDYQIQQIIENFQEGDLNILITHHPVNYLFEWERKIITNKIYKYFDLHFFGHMHDLDIAKSTNQIGNLISVQTGALFSDYYSNNCYSQITWTLNSNLLNIVTRSYDDKNLSWNSDSHAKDIKLRDNNLKNTIKDRSLDIKDYYLICSDSILKDFKKNKLSESDVVELLQKSFIGHQNYFIHDYDKLPIPLENQLYILLSKQDYTIDLHRIISCAEQELVKIASWNNVILNYRKLTYFSYRKSIKNPIISDKEFRLAIKGHSELRKLIIEYFEKFESCKLNNSSIEKAKRFDFFLTNSFQSTEQASFLFKNRRSMDINNLNGQLIVTIESSLTNLHKVISSYFPEDEF